MKEVNKQRTIAARSALPNGFKFQNMTLYFTTQLVDTICRVVASCSSRLVLRIYCMNLIYAILYSSNLRALFVLGKKARLNLMHTLVSSF